jgi:hypothetical protein
MLSALNLGGLAITLLPPEPDLPPPWDAHQIVLAMGHSGTTVGMKDVCEPPTTHIVNDVELLRAQITLHGGGSGQAGCRSVQGMQSDAFLRQRTIELKGDDVHLEAAPHELLRKLPGPMLEPSLLRIEFLEDEGNFHKGLWLIAAAMHTLMTS